MTSVPYPIYRSIIILIKTKQNKVCGGTFTELSGIIQSPNFPSPYPASKQCVYVIALDPGKAVRLDFLNFDVEDAASCLFDFVEVFVIPFFVQQILEGFQINFGRSAVCDRFETEIQAIPHLSADTAALRPGFLLRLSALTTTCGLNSKQTPRSII